MKLASIVALAFLFAVTPACESLTGSGTPAMDANALGGVDINKILSGITDKPSAEAAKGPLDGAVAQLKAAVAGAKPDAESGAAEGGDMAQGAVAGIMSKFGISSETTGMITGLLDNPAVKGVLGSTLEQLKGLIPAM